ncbi:MAG TPA: methionyl-tRNA formyltransferase [Firmicutes bacterium]|nr:methionyl-tRNA formyltransferase [Bacillota bacterium]
MRTVFMGSPDFAVESLKALHQCSFIELLGVVTQPDRPKGRGLKIQPPPVKVFAEQIGIPVWQPERVAAPDFMAQMRLLSPELIVVVAFGQKIPTALLELPPLGCINVHGSLLPEYRGAAPIHRAIIDGRTVTGVTTMYLDAGWDTGDMILKRELNIAPDETVGSLHDRMALAGGGLLAQTATCIRNGNAPRIAQDHQKATYAPKLNSADGLIHWDQSALEIGNLIRGLDPWPSAFTYYGDRQLRLYCPEVIDQDLRNFPSGAIVKIDKGQGFIVSTGKGSLLIKEVQPAGKKRMSAGAFLQGYPLEQGDRFESRVP